MNKRDRKQTFVCLCVIAVSCKSTAGLIWDLLIAFNFYDLFWCILSLISFGIGIAGLIEGLYHDHFWF